MHKQYLYKGVTGFYFIDTYDRLEDFHKGIKLIGEINSMIRIAEDNMSDLEQALKTNGDLRSENERLKKLSDELEHSLRALTVD